MQGLLKHAELFEGLSEGDLQQLAAIGQRQSLRAGEYLFLLGEDALALYVVTKGTLSLCFPMPVGGTARDISVESVKEGKALGWSALVQPYRFTLSARATEPSEVVGFPRRALVDLFDREPRLGSTFFMRISELVGIRLATVQALWLRELRWRAERPSQIVA
jgi:CRP/FNR family transcriptional regulator